MSDRELLVSCWNAAGIALIFAALSAFPPQLGGQNPPPANRGAEDRSPSSDQATEEILKAHAIGRRAHVLADPDLLVSLVPGRHLEVNAGRISNPTAEEFRRRFAGYFGSVRFLEWEDVRPPLVSVAPSGDWGEVVVEKRVRTLPLTATGEESSVRYAWTERWLHDSGAWTMATISSTDRHDPDSIPVPLADRIAAWTVLQKSRAVLGGDRAVANTEMLRFVAECQGPRGSFRTTVASARDGRVLFLQEFPTRPRYRAGISLGRRWEESDGRLVDSLTPVTESVLRAHEMLLVAISPEARYSAPASRADEMFEGRTVQVIRFRDGLGAPVDFLFDPATGRPAAFRPVNQTGQGERQIITRFEDWRATGNVILPHAITMTQGADTYRYRMTEISTDWIEDRAFRP